MERFPDTPFATLTGKALLNKLSSLPGWRGALGPGGLAPGELFKVRTLASEVSKLVVEPLPHLCDYLVAVVGMELARFNIRYVRLEKSEEGTEELLFLPDHQFAGGITRDGPAERGAAVALATQVLGFLSEEDIAFLWELALEAPKGGHFLEIGSYCGKSASLLTAALRARGEAGRLFCVDPWSETGATHSDAYRALADSLPHPAGNRSFEVFLYNAAANGFLDRLVPLRTRSESVTPLFDGLFSLIFVDGHHSYVSVKRDAAVAVPTLAQGGIIAFHDVCDSWPEVRSFVEGEFAKLPGFEPLGAAGSVTAFRKI